MKLPKSKVGFAVGLTLAIAYLIVAGVVLSARCADGIGCFGKIFVIPFLLPFLAIGIIPPSSGSFILDFAIVASPHAILIYFIGYGLGLLNEKKSVAS
ncbi:MAG: hypothetical protein HY435_01240 [Candidatus Liptonbacteria bacterium]|nr:hypothetical protein [Candidatus Liptonbacteria bacterium]